MPAGKARASGLVTAITIRKSAIEALEENHLRPSITHSSPSRTARVAELRGIRARRVRLGHAEGAAQVAGEQGVQPAVLLLRRAGQREDLRVAGVGRGVAEGERRDRRGAEDLVHQPQAHLPHALAAELGWQVSRPQAALLDLLLQRCDRAGKPVKSQVVPDRLERPDLLAHELGHPVELLLEVGIGGEVPAHDIASFRWRTEMTSGQRTSWPLLPHRPRKPRPRSALRAASDGASAPVYWAHVEQHATGDDAACRSARAAGAAPARAAAARRPVRRILRCAGAARGRHRAARGPARRPGRSRARGGKRRLRVGDASILPHGERGRRDYRLALPLVEDPNVSGTTAGGLVGAIEELSDERLSAIPYLGPWTAGTLGGLFDVAATLERPVTLVANLATQLPVGLTGAGEPAARLPARRRGGGSAARLGRRSLRLRLRPPERARREPSTGSPTRTPRSAARACTCSRSSSSPPPSSDARSRRGA